MINRFIILSTIYFLVFSTVGLAERPRISLAPKAGIYSVEDVEKEILFGREMAAILLSDKTIIADQALSRYVSLVGNSVLQHANRSDLNFYFAVIKSPEINAYAAPGGYIFITTAALQLMQNEAELAGVLAHEIAHIADRHIVKVLKIRADDKSMTALAGKLTGNNTQSAKIVFDQAVGQALEILFSKGLNHEDEYNADQQGLLLATLSGYDPSQYLNFLDRIRPRIEKDNGELSKTHPGFNERIDRLKSMISDEGLLALGRMINKERFMKYRKNGEIE
ncbi:MAG: putative Zn-dependent protease [Gammaproteobacteria bacterium]